MTGTSGSLYRKAALLASWHGQRDCPGSDRPESGDELPVSGSSSHPRGFSCFSQERTEQCPAKRKKLMVADALGTGFRIVPPGGIGRFLSFFERVRRAPCFFPSLLLIILIASMPLRPDPSAAGAVRPAIAEPGDVTVEMTTDPAQIRAGSAAALTFTFRDPDGRPVRDLEIREDHLLHVMIVSEDLGVFAHIHPEDAGEKPPEKDRGARFTVRYTFPRAGRYLISVDYALKGVRYSRQFFLSVSEPHRLDTI